MIKQKEYIVKIPLNEFIGFLKWAGILESLFIGHSTFSYLTENEIKKFFNRDNDITIEFNEGIGEDVKVEIDHITLKSIQKIIKPIAKKRK